MQEIGVQLFDNPHTRYERLRRLVDRYELGELSDDDFKRLKQQILLGHATAENTAEPQVCLLLAVFAGAAGIDASLEAIRSLSRARRARIVDAATISKYTSGSVHIRAISDLTKTPAVGDVSIVGAICGLLFPPEALHVEHFGSSLAMSLGVLSWDPTHGQDLRVLGQSVHPGSSAVLIVCWPSVVNKLTSALRGFESVTHLPLRGPLADMIVAIIADTQDSEPAGP
jgi:uncharacterized membrane protein